jgi:predicted RecA/RadA family phage recombinase
MARYVSAGTTLDYTPTAAVSAGDVVVLSDLLAVATHDIEANKLGAVAYTGLWSLPKAAEALSQGDAVYWDASASAVTATASGNTFAGHAAADAASGDSDVAVILNV